VEARDREVVGDVVVPTLVAMHAGRRTHRQLERVDGLIAGRLGLQPQLHERLADVGVVLEGEAVLDVEEHGQVTKYCVVSASCAWAIVSTTRSRNAASAPVAAPRWSCYARSACRRPTRRIAGLGAPPPP